jgi:uncharacterized protein YukE
VWVVARDLRVDPTDLGLSANQVDVSADDLRTAHTAAQERVAGASAGWIGKSATALAAKAEHWEQESASHYAEMCRHGAHFRSAAEKYVSTDSTSASGLSTVAEKIGTLGL